MDSSQHSILSILSTIYTRTTVQKARHGVGPRGRRQHPGGNGLPGSRARGVWKRRRPHVRRREGSRPRHQLPVGEVGSRFALRSAQRLPLPRRLRLNSLPGNSSSALRRKPSRPATAGCPPSLVDRDRPGDGGPPSVESCCGRCGFSGSDRIEVVLRHVYILVMGTH